MYPHHGAAVIEDVVEREMFGKQRTYAKLHFSHGSLTLMVPLDSTAQVGLRGVASKSVVKKVFDVLREEQGWMPIIWSQRYKTNLAKLISGDIYQGAELVRDLSCRDRDKGLSAAEKRLLDKARQILISELTFAFDSTEENAEAMLDKVLTEPGPRLPPRVVPEKSMVPG
jgi:CarD family transcriptional regulator, regulator of rRNA transcription